MRNTPIVSDPSISQNSAGTKPAKMFRRVKNEKRHSTDRIPMMAMLMTRIATQ